MSSCPLPFRLALATLLVCSSPIARPVVAAGGILPENPHRAGHLICSACHVAVSPPARAGVARIRMRLAIPGADPVGPMLLREDPVDLCLGCHDGQAGVPDVIGDDVNGLQERAAGFFDLPGVPNPNGHTLGRAGNGETSLRPGPAMPTVDVPMDGTVTCVDCHDPHGGATARQLRLPADSSTAALGLFVDPGATGLGRYEASRVTYGTLDNVALRELTVVCRPCHPRCSALRDVDPDHDGEFERHPSYDSVDGGRVTVSAGAGQGVTSPAHWLSGTGPGFLETQRVPVVVRGAGDYDAARVRDADRDAVFCLSCHKAHGSGEAFALVWRPGRGHEQACGQCHPAGTAADRGR